MDEYPPVDDDNAHIAAYHTILRLFAILILKIEDDLWLASKTMERSVVIGEAQI